MILSGDAPANQNKHTLLFLGQDCRRPPEIPHSQKCRNVLQESLQKRISMVRQPQPAGDGETSAVGVRGGKQMKGRGGAGWQGGSDSLVLQGEYSA